MKERIAGFLLSFTILLYGGCGLWERLVSEPTQPPAPVAEPASEPTQHLKPLPPPPSLAEPQGQVLVVIASQLNLRICPSMECQIIAILPKGQEVVKLGDEGGWLKVRVPAMQKEGWVGARYVGITTQKPLVPPPPSPPPLQPPEMKEGWTIPGEQEAPTKQDQITQDDPEAGQVSEEWAPFEQEETTELRQEEISSGEQTLPEVKEEFAK